MAILLFTLIAWWLFSIKVAMIYFGIVAAATLIMSWFSAFSSVGIASNASEDERREVFRMLLFGAVVGTPWPPLHVIGIIAALAFHFLSK